MSGNWRKPSACVVKGALPILVLVLFVASAAAQPSSHSARPDAGPVAAADDPSGSSLAAAADTVDSATALEPIESMSLESLLSDEIRGGEMGGYGLRLSEFNARSELHGYFSAELNGSTRDKVSTYDLHHAVLIARADFFGRVVPEMAIEWEHMGTEQYVAYAQVDLKSSSALIFRVGQFVAPVGAFNEYQYPDFLRKTVVAPIAMTSIIPSLWSEVGVQVRGKVVDRAGRGVNYALFSSNGLEQVDPIPGDGIVPEGGSIRNMTMHARDLNNSGKALGGRLGATVTRELEFGLSGYRGAYTSDGRRDLTLLDSDLIFHPERFTLRVEVAVARQEVTGGQLDKRGGYALLAVHATPALEPYVQLESVDLHGHSNPIRRRLIGGAVYSPFPEAARNVMAKFEGALTRYGTQDPFAQLLTQLTLGF
jgi:hypothetical protein